MCDLHMHIYHYDREGVVLTLFDQSDFKDAVESQIRKVNKGSATSVAESSFELNQRVLLLHLGIRT